jgi:hypothetical protein
VSIAILIAAVVIICGVIVVAKGGGGELARDLPPVPAEPDVWTGAEVAHFRPPPALLGYDPAATERAFHVIGRSIAERDEEIAWLRGRLSELQPETMPDAAGPRSQPDEPAPGPRSQPDEPAPGPQ